jgi:hypothetical protein
MSILRRVLNLAREPSSARERLRVALANRAHVQAELEAAQAAVARVQGVIDEARAAKRRALNARGKANDAARIWAGNGALPAESSYVEEMSAIADVAETESARAEGLAAAATNAVGAVKAREDACASALNDAVTEIRNANAMVYIEERIAAKLVERERLARQAEKLDIELLGFYRTVSPARPGWRDSIEHESAEAAKVVQAGLARCRIRDPGERVVVNGFHRAGTDPCPELAERTQWWRARMRQSREDPDVQF